MQMKDCKEYIFQRLLNGPSNVLREDKVENPLQCKRKSGCTNTN